MNDYGHALPDKALIQQQLKLAFAVRSNTSRDRLLVDNFAGGGGVSKGIEMAFGRPVDVAINHDGEALLMHIANHPQTAHYQEDVFGIHPGFVTGNRQIGLAWFSPDCTHHSKAKGGKPRSQKIRGLAWVALKWGAMRRPDCIAIENVPDLLTWGPLDGQGKPDKEQAGRTFRAFIAALTTGVPPDHPDLPEIRETLGIDFPMARLHAGLGYVVEWRVLKAHEFGVPQKRQRLFILCRSDGLPIRWPTPTHGDPLAKAFAEQGLQPWKTAADCIDFGITSQSVFARSKPLATNTLRRVAKGIWRHVFTAPKPFVVPQSSGPNSHTTRRRPIFDPNLTGPTEVGAAPNGRLPMVAANLVAIGYGERKGQEPRTQSVSNPLGVIVTSVTQALVTARLTHIPLNLDRGVPAANESRSAEQEGKAETLVTSFLEQANGGFYDGSGHPCSAPMSTVTGAGSQQRLVHAYLVKYYSNGGQWQELDEPMHTLPTKARMGLIQVRQIRADHLPAKYRARARQCAALLHEHLPEHFSEPADLVLFQHEGVVWAMVDITLRMLNPRELARAQGFPDDYVLDPKVRKPVAAAHGTAKKRGNGSRAATPRYRSTPLSKTAQIRMIGNSVPPPLVKALLQANFEHLLQPQQLAA